MNVLELEQSFKNKVAPLYIISGNDYFYRKMALTKLLALVSEDLSTFNVTYLAHDAKVDAVIIALNTPPIMSDYKLVVWQGDIKKMNKDTAKVVEKSLTNYLKNKVDGSVLIMVDEIDFFKPIAKLGEIVDCNKLSTTDLITQVKLLLDSKGVIMDNVLIRELAVRCDNEMSAIVSEVDKLVAYANGDVITAESMSAVVTHNVEQDVFKLTDAIARNDIDFAYTLLADLLSRGEQPLKLQALILGQYKRMFYTKVSKDSVEEIAKQLGGSSYPYKLARGNAAKYKPMELKRIVDTLHNIEYEQKSGRISMDEGLNLAMATVTKRR